MHGGDTEKQAACMSLTGESLFQFRCGRRIHRALAVAVEQCGISAVTQQQRTHLHSILTGRLVQRRELPQVHGVNARPVLWARQTGKY